MEHAGSKCLALDVAVVSPIKTIDERLQNRGHEQCVCWLTGPLSV